MAAAAVRVAAVLRSRRAARRTLGTTAGGALCLPNDPAGGGCGGAGGAVGLAGTLRAGGMSASCVSGTTCVSPSSPRADSPTPAVSGALRFRGAVAVALALPREPKLSSGKPSGSSSGSSGRPGSNGLRPGARPGAGAGAGSPRPGDAFFLGGMERFKVARHAACVLTRAAAG